MTARTVLSLFVTLALANLSGACGGGPPEPARALGTTAARASSSSSSSNCFATGPYTVLEVGKTPNIEPKKIAEGCWWQGSVQRIHGFVDESLGWEFCNSCDVDVEFQLTDVPVYALYGAGCTLFFDASGAGSKTVSRNDTRFVDCMGLHELDTQTYNARARVAQTQGPFIPADPEIEIEDRHGFAYQARLAATFGVTQCLTKAVGTGPGRLTISGQFTPTRPGAYVALLSTGPSPLGTSWSGDLVEYSPRQGEGTAQPQKAQAFSVSTELPAFVTEFVLRTLTEPRKAAEQKIGFQTLASCPPGK
jgi:hypothetical protein